MTIDTLAPQAEIDRRQIVVARLTEIRAAIAACGVDAHRAEHLRLGQEYDALLKSRPIRAWRDLPRSHPDNVRADELNAARQAAFTAMNVAVAAVQPLREKEVTLSQWLEGESIMTFDHLLERTTV